MKKYEEIPDFPKTQLNHQKLEFIFNRKILNFMVLLESFSFFKILFYFMSSYLCTI